MAEITLKLTDTAGRPVQYEALLRWEWSREDGVPCDALQAHLLAALPLPEIERVQLMADGITVFNGYCDLQRERADSNGSTVDIYARSTACLLTDNEAEPRVYTQPSVLALFLTNAKGMPFHCHLPETVCENDYTVSPGTSCFAVLDNFMTALCNRHIAVSPDNRIYLPEGNGCCRIYAQQLLSESKITERGSAISVIDYKTAGDSGYAHHLMSRTLSSQAICRSKKVSLSALPAWQQNAALLGKLQTAAAQYRRLEVTADGCYCPDLYDRLDYPSALTDKPTDYRITAITVSSSAQGVQTHFCLSRPIELKEITYVA